MFEPGCGPLADGGACAIGVSGRPPGACRAAAPAATATGQAPAAPAILDGTAATGNRCRTARQARRPGGNRHAAGDRGGPPALSRRGRQGAPSPAGLHGPSRHRCLVPPRRPRLPRPSIRRLRHCRRSAAIKSRPAAAMAGSAACSPPCPARLPQAWPRNFPPHSARLVGRQGPYSGKRRRCGRRI